MPGAIRNMLLWGLIFGTLGFAAGFALGTLRELVLIPALGERIGHLTEFPMVTLTTCAIGIWAGRKSTAPALGIGLLGVATLVAFESTLALGVMRLRLGEYLAGYELTRGALFPIGLTLMAV